MAAAAGEPEWAAKCRCVAPWWNGLDVTRRPEDMWIIDFGLSMTEGEAAFYVEP